MPESRNAPRGSHAAQRSSNVELTPSPAVRPVANSISSNREHALMGLGLELCVHKRGQDGVPGLGIEPTQAACPRRWRAGDRASRVPHGCGTATLQTHVHADMRGDNGPPSEKNLSSEAPNQWHFSARLSGLRGSRGRGDQRRSQPPAFVPTRPRNSDRDRQSRTNKTASAIPIETTVHSQCLPASRADRAHLEPLDE